MRLLFVVPLFALLSFSQPTPNKSESSWELIKEVDGVKIYARKPEGSDVSELRIKSTIRGNSLSSFVGLFQDIQTYDKWVYSCEKAHLLEKFSETEMLYYIKSDFPWPFDDRDFVVRNKVWQDKKSLAFHSKSWAQKHSMPTKVGVVRITDFNAEWIITPAKNGSFQLLYTFHSDPGGSLPSWLVNSFIEFGPLKTIKAMEAEAKNVKYAKARFAFIKEPTL